MSSLRVTSLRGRTEGTAPTLPDGAVVTGVVTATTLSGNVSGGSISGTTGTFTGNVSIAGTLTYDDVTRIDSVGIVTAGGGLYVGRTEGVGTGIGLTATTAGHVIAAGIITTGTCLKVGSVSGGTFGAGVGVTITGDGNAVFSGISTFAGGVNYSGGGTLREKINITAGKLSDNLNIDLDNGMTHYFTTTESTTSTPNIISSAGINTELSIGETAAITVITSAAAAGYSVKWKVDGKDTGITTSWVGGSVPTAGNASGLDTYALTLIKTASETYTIINNLVNSA